MKEVAPVSHYRSGPDSIRADVGGSNRDFDFVRRPSVPPQSQFAEGQVITQSDIMDTIERSVDGNGKSHVLLKDGYEAVVEETENNRRRIVELSYIERGTD